MISLNLDQETEHMLNTNEILTFVEYLEHEEKAREKQNITNPLNKAEMLLIYVCYFIDRVFPNKDIYNCDNAAPLDIALINHTFIKLAENDFTYEDRTKWITDTVKSIYDIYYMFLMNDDFDKLFRESFSVLDNLIFRMVMNTAEMRAQPWEYLGIYDKKMIPILFAKYINGYLDIVNNIYEDDYDEEIEDVNQNSMEMVNKYIM